MAETKVSKKQQACVNRYIDKAYDRINLTVIKGKRAVIQEHAKAQQESTNEFINRAIDETMKRDAERSEKTSE